MICCYRKHIVIGLLSRIWTNLGWYPAIHNVPIFELECNGWLYQMLYLDRGGDAGGGGGGGGFSTPSLFP